MTVHLTITDEQAKALQWFVGSMTSGVCDDLNLSRIYDSLYDKFGFVTVSGVERSADGCWKRVDGERAALFVNQPPPKEHYIDASVV